MNMFTITAPPAMTSCNPGGKQRRRCASAGCSKLRQAPTAFCKRHGGGYRCGSAACSKSAASGTYFCEAHVSELAAPHEARTELVTLHRRQCQSRGGCQQLATRVVHLCKLHGGGKRCTETGCTKSASGRTTRCVAHGGGKRCTELGCSKSAVGASSLCVRHGGGRRCVKPGCQRSARSRTHLCQAHRDYDISGVDAVRRGRTGSSYSSCSSSSSLSNSSSVVGSPSSCSSSSCYDSADEDASLDSGVQLLGLGIRELCSADYDLLSPPPVSPVAASTPRNVLTTPRLKVEPMPFSPYDTDDDHSAADARWLGTCAALL